jgi:hypothetical protein
MNPLLIILVTLAIYAVWSARCEGFFSLTPKFIAPLSSLEPGDDIVGPLNAMCGLVPESGPQQSCQRMVADCSEVIESLIRHAAEIDEVRRNLHYHHAPDDVIIATVSQRSADALHDVAADTTTCGDRFKTEGTTYADDVTRLLQILGGDDSFRLADVPIGPNMYLGDVRTSIIRAGGSAQDAASVVQMFANAAYLISR